MTFTGPGNFTGVTRCGELSKQDQTREEELDALVLLPLHIPEYET